MFMNIRGAGYHFINVFVILLAGGIFVYGYGDFCSYFEDMAATTWCMFLAALILVHVFKAVRLYLVLYGAELVINNHVKTYCKVTAVSMIFPFKIGELFRIYCYGILIQDAIKGMIIIVLDRFMDTIALISVIIFIWLVNGVRIAAVTYFLLAFLILILVIFFSYPGIYAFWKEYLLKAKSTEHRLKMLRLLGSINKIYCETMDMVKGRGIILYILSVIAWGIEIGSVYVSNKGTGEYIGQIISYYLTSAINGGQSIELKRFIAASVFLLICFYIAIKMYESFVMKKGKDESNRYI